MSTVVIEQVMVESIAWQELSPTVTRTLSVESDPL